MEKRRKAPQKSPPSPAHKETSNNPSRLSSSSLTPRSRSPSQPAPTQPDQDTAEQSAAESEQVKSPLPIRLPTKCKPKTDSDSDSDSRSTKSSASSSGKVSKVLKKTFKGKAIAIVKPFSNAVTEKKSPPNEKQKEIEARLNLYDFGSDEDRDSSQRNKVDESSEKKDTEKDGLQVTSDLVSLKSNSSSSISSIKGIKRIKSVKQGLLSSRRLKLNPELKSVRVRVEKLRKNSSRNDKLEGRQNLAKSKASSAKARLKEKESAYTSGKESSISNDKSVVSSDLDSVDKSQEKVLGESGSPSITEAESCLFRGSDISVPECKEEPGVAPLVHNRAEDTKTELAPLSPGPAADVKLEPVSSEIQSVSYQSDSSGQLLLKNDRINEIVKSEIFSQPSSLNKDSVKVKLEKSVSERNEDSSLLRNR